MNTFLYICYNADTLFFCDDILLLCSDGLTKAMSEDEIAQLITANADIPAAIPQALTSTAFSKHWIKHDNITAAIVSCS